MMADIQMRFSYRCKTCKFSAGEEVGVRNHIKETHPELDAQNAPILMRLESKPPNFHQSPFDHLYPRVPVMLANHPANVDPMRMVVGVRPPFPVPVGGRVPPGGYPHPPRMFFLPPPPSPGAVYHPQLLQHHQPVALDGMRSSTATFVRNIENNPTPLSSASVEVLPARSSPPELIPPPSLSQNSIDEDQDATDTATALSNNTELPSLIADSTPEPAELPTEFAGIPAQEDILERYKLRKRKLTPSDSEDKYPASAVIRTSARKKFGAERKKGKIVQESPLTKDQTPIKKAKPIKNSVNPSRPVKKSTGQQPPNACRLCNKSIRPDGEDGSTFAEFSHVVEKHLSIPLLLCYYCDFGVNSTDEALMTNHMNNKHPYKKNEHLCDIDEGGELRTEIDKVARQCFGPRIKWTGTMCQYWRLTDSKKDSEKSSTKIQKMTPEKSPAPERKGQDPEKGKSGKMRVSQSPSSDKGGSNICRLCNESVVPKEGEGTFEHMKHIVKDHLSAPLMTCKYCTFGVQSVEECKMYDHLDQKHPKEKSVYDCAEGVLVPEIRKLAKRCFGRQFKLHGFYCDYWRVTEEEDRYKGPTKIEEVVELICKSKKSVMKRLKEHPEMKITPEDLKTINWVTMRDFVECDLNNFKTYFTKRALAQADWLKRSLVEEWFCSTCRTATVAGDLVQCDDCDTWHHYTCAGLTEGIEEDYWACDKCKNDSKSGTKGSSK